MLYVIRDTGSIIDSKATIKVVLPQLIAQLILAQLTILPNFQCRTPGPLALPRKIMRNAASVSGLIAYGTVRYGLITIGLNLCISSYMTNTVTELILT